MGKQVGFWLTAGAVFALDRVAKVLVREFIPPGSSVDVGFFSLTHVMNTGTLFGLLKSASWFFALFAIVVSVYLVAKHASFEKKLQPVLGLVLAGALGNLVDRLMYGAVIDFIDFHFWPVFNIADTAISIAVVLLLVFELRGSATFK